jgi:hypothetical protein
MLLLVCAGGIDLLVTINILKKSIETILESTNVFDLKINAQSTSQGVTSYGVEYFFNWLRNAAFMQSEISLLYLENLPLDSILNQLNPIHISIICFYKISYKIIHTFMPSSPSDQTANFILRFLGQFLASVHLNGLLN